jgi:hypothetical protein
MIPALLASVGLPLLVRAVGSALDGVDHPMAKAAAGALSQVGQALTDKAIPPEQVAEANRHLERMTDLDTAETRHTLAQINASLRAEARSDDWYVRRWRPTFGYAVALTWTATMIAVSWSIIDDPTQAPAIIAALVNTSPIWGIALGVLGVAVVKRSQDKARLGG